MKKSEDNMRVLKTATCKTLSGPEKAKAPTKKTPAKTVTKKASVKKAAIKKRAMFRRKTAQQ